MRLTDRNIKMSSSAVLYKGLIALLFLSLVCSACKSSEGLRDTVAKQLVAMEARDQALRSMQNVDVNEVLRVDAENSAALAKIMSDVGWPGVSDFGKEAADAAVLLAIHADRSPEVQRRALELMEPMVESKEADPQKFAYLWDRVHTPQRFGTQGGCVGAQWEPNEIEEAEQVDHRRAAIGMAPLADYINLASEMCSP